MQVFILDKLSDKIQFFISFFIHNFKHSGNISKKLCFFKNPDLLFVIS